MTMTMWRHLGLAVAAATLVGAALDPGDAFAHRRGTWHRAARHGHGWGSDPRASRAGYYGPHYGRDCYRAANGRSICPPFDHSL
jgi:hypothetical protein